MADPLYKINKKISYKFFYKFLVGFLISWFICPPVFSQQIPRGLFLQDQGGGEEGSFRTGPKEEEEVPGGQGVSPDMLGMEEGRGTMGSSGIYGRAMIYQVHVLGEVRKPGTYRVNPSMRVTDALQQGGGIKPNGSERFVELRKSGQAHGQVLDLFAYKTFGNLAQNPYLQDNDTIYVPLKKMAIEIEGPVRRPGVFELKNEHTVNDVVQLAGGFTVGASQKDPIKIIRYGGFEEKEIIEVPMDSADMQNIQVHDGDVIVVPHKFLTQHQFDYNLKKLPNDNIFYPAYENRVFVIGAVRAPGAFEFNQYYTLRQYLTLAGGTTIMAKNGQIKVLTADGKSFKAKNGNYDRVVNPGDTIVIPEKQVPTSFYIGLLPTIASLGLSAAALFR